MVGAAKIRSVVDKKVLNEVEFVEVDAIPVDESHVATNRDAEKYGHFRGIQLVELQRKEVGVLIGTDCSNAFSVLRYARRSRTNRSRGRLITVGVCWARLAMVLAKESFVMRLWMQEHARMKPSTSSLRGSFVKIFRKQHRRSLDHLNTNR